jgi:1-phosphofructokinase
MIVTVTPNPSIDRTYRLAALTIGQLNRAETVSAEASGKGVNVSRVLARLGVPTRAVVTVGGPEGRLLARLLDQTPQGLLDGTVTGMTVDLVKVAGSTRVNVTLVVPGREPTKVNEPGAPLSPDEADTLVADTSRALASGASWLACCGSLPTGSDPDLVARVVAAGRAAGVPVAVDSSGAALATAVRSCADLVKPNADELVDLVGPGLTAVEAARKVQGQTGGTVLASLGAKGAVLVTPDGAWLATPPSITPVNSTGAGDAALAGYLGAPVSDPAGRLAYAVAVGTSACLVEATAGLPARLLGASAVKVRSL